MSKVMTKLEELKATRDATWAAYEAARDAAWAACADAAADAAVAAYHAELKKTQEENSND